MAFYSAFSRYNLKFLILTIGKKRSIAKLVFFWHLNTPYKLILKNPQINNSVSFYFTIFWNRIMQPTNLHTSFTTTSLSKKPMFDEKRQKLLNGVGLAICKGVGFSQRQMRHNAFSLDESKLAYICGKNIIVYDLKTEIQKVFERP